MRSARTISGAGDARAQILEQLRMLTAVQQ